MRIVFFLLVVSAIGRLPGQKIGEWTTHIPYNGPRTLAESEEHIFCGTATSFYTIHKQYNDIQTYSTVDGMSDIGISVLGYSLDTEALLIAYENGNIDVMKNRRFFNLPGIKNSQSIVGAKTVQHLYFNDIFAYLACNFGIVKINLERMEIAETYRFGENGSDIYVYAS